MTTLCGTEGGADMKDGLRLNGVEFSGMYVKKPVLGANGADFYDGKVESAAEREIRLWIESIVNDTEPLVKPEQALVVTEILEAIYESSRTGQPVYFNK
jgi:predicted dehydrogenase